jgi:uncharacterized protein (TIGR00251 family)
MSTPDAVNLHIQPRASRSEVVGHHGDAIKIRITAPPVEGAANKELIRFLARKLSVPQGAIQLLSGESGRRKRVAVDGLSAQDVSQRLLTQNRT